MLDAARAGEAKFGRWFLPGLAVCSRHAQVDPGTATVVHTVLDTLTPVLTMPEATVLPLVPQPEGWRRRAAAIGAQGESSDAARGWSTPTASGGTFVDYHVFPS